MQNSLISVDMFKKAKSKSAVNINEPGVAQSQEVKKAQFKNIDSLKGLKSR